MAFKAYLAGKKISQSEAARRLGVPHSTVWRWLEGENKPSRLARKMIKAELGFDWKD